MNGSTRSAHERVQALEMDLAETERELDAVRRAGAEERARGPAKARQAQSAAELAEVDAAFAGLDWARQGDTSRLLAVASYRFRGNPEALARCQEHCQRLNAEHERKVGYLIAVVVIVLVLPVAILAIVTC